MKSFLLALLFVTVVLLAAAESRKGFKRGGASEKKRGGNWGSWVTKICSMKELPSNCSEFVDDTCVECDEGFAIREVSWRPRCNKTICVPCQWTLKRNHPDVFRKQCIKECPNNCSRCEGVMCKECEQGFFRVQTKINRTICLPCGPRMRKNWPKVFFKECPEKGCGKGCVKCSGPRMCSQCDEGLLFFTPPSSNITECIKSCPPFFKRDKDSSRCELKPTRTPLKPKNKCGKHCFDCSEEGKCLMCDRPLRRIKLVNQVRCMRKCPRAYRGHLDPDSQVMICEKALRKQKGGKKTQITSDTP